MCDPITGLVAGVLPMLFGGKNDAPPPPPPVIPPTPMSARAPGAEVKVGDGANATASATTPAYQGFNEKRVFGKPLGGLGKGGLGL